MQRISESTPDFNVEGSALVRALELFRRNVTRLLNKESYGNASISPDANGNGTIAHGLNGTPSFVSVDIGGDNVYGVDPESVDGTNITVRVKDAAGADVTSGSYTIYWTAKLA